MRSSAWVARFNYNNSTEDFYSQNNLWPRPYFLILLRLFGTLSFDICQFWLLFSLSLMSLPCSCFLGQPNICVLAGRSCTLAQQKITFHVKKNIREAESTKKHLPSVNPRVFTTGSVDKAEKTRGAKMAPSVAKPWSCIVAIGPAATTGWCLGAVSIAWHNNQQSWCTEDSEHSEDVEWDWVTGCDCQDLQVNSAYDMFQRSNAQIETWLWFARLQGQGKADQQRIFMARFGSGALITASFELLQWTFLGNTEGNRTGELRFRSRHSTTFDTL